MTFVAYRTKDDDNGQTLANQLGLKGDEARKFIAAVGEQTSVQLQNTSGETKRLFSIIEKLYASQLRHTAKGNKLGPTHAIYADCSSTPASWHFLMRISLGTIGVP